MPPTIFGGYSQDSMRTRKTAPPPSAGVCVPYREDQRTRPRGGFDARPFGPFPKTLPRLLDRLGRLGDRLALQAVAEELQRFLKLCIVGFVVESLGFPVLALDHRNVRNDAAGVRNRIALGVSLPVDVR